MTVLSGPVDVAVASSAADAAAVAAAEQHHAALAGTLGAHVGALLTTAAAGGEAFATARDRAGVFLQGELAPHAEAEEQALYPAAATSERAKLLIDGMLAEHRAIAQLAREVTSAADPVERAPGAHGTAPAPAQLTDRAGGDLTVSYEQRGPDAWRLLLTRG